MLCRFCHRIAIILLASSTLTASLGETNALLSFREVEEKALRKGGAPKAAPSSPVWARAREKGSSHTPPDYRVTRWSAENGLPQNTIKALIQTQDGYLW